MVYKLLIQLTQQWDQQQTLRIQLKLNMYWIGLQLLKNTTMSLRMFLQRPKDAFNILSYISIIDRLPLIIFCHNSWSLDSLLNLENRLCNLWLSYLFNLCYLYPVYEPGVQFLNGVTWKVFWYMSFNIVLNM